MGTGPVTSLPLDSDSGWLDLASCAHLPNLDVFCWKRMRPPDNMTSSPPYASLASKPQDLSLSSLQQFIADSAGKKSPRSKSGTPEGSESQNLALQVAHNLHFQHEWTD